MKVEINLNKPEKILEAKIGQHLIICDQPIEDGGEDSFPEPLAFFLVSTALCAGHYIKSFCNSRSLPFEDIKITQHYQAVDETNRYKKKLIIEIDLPKDFPEKYKKALIRSASGCAVKKIIQNMPEFEIAIK